MKWLRASLGLVLVLAGAACGNDGGNGGRAVTTSARTLSEETVNATEGLRVGVVGPLRLDTAGIVVERGTLGQVGSASLVIVSARSATLPTVAAAARAHPGTHYALLGESTKSDRVKNLVGLVLSDDQAAVLAGTVAGYAAADLGGTAPRVAWVGPQELPLAASFARGVHSALPGAVVLDEWSSSIPARCKEAALTAIARGAMVVMAHDGICAESAIAGARQQNVAGLQLGDFQFPAVAANLLARDAVAGVFHGGEDLTFGAASGAVGVGILDPRIPLDVVVRARAAAQTLVGGTK
jgi:basic membrane lipoprotein Med (substrate-binding protein (PBP1-ABC) superfamily)